MLKQRNYLVKFRFVIQYKGSKRNDSFYAYYLPRWGIFLKALMKTQLSPSMLRDLPYLRKVVPPTLQVEDISDALINKNPHLARLLIEASPIFNSSPHDMKIYVLSCFGINSDEYSDLDMHVRICTD